MKLETYGKRNVFNQFVQDIKDKFKISEAQKIMCSKHGVEPYRTPVKRINIIKALPLTILAILTPAPPITAAGLVYFARVGLK